MCDLRVFPNPLLDMCLLMNLSFINILSKFNSITFCLRCCYDDDDDIDIQSPPSLFLPHHLHSIHISICFFSALKIVRVLAYSFCRSFVYLRYVCMYVCMHVRVSPCMSISASMYVFFG